MAKILVVEDKNDEREIFSDILKSANHNATCVPNSDEALKLLNKEKFDLICLDQRMPGKSGTDIYTLLKEQENFAKIAVIFITAFDNDPEIQKLREQGIPVIKKPIDYKEVINLISSVLKKRILIVEDRKDDREILIDIFKLDGYEVQDASNAEQALEILKNEDFDLVVTDYALPDSTGEELYHQIKDKLQQDNIPFLFTSIHGSKIDQKGLLKQGVHYIDKPFDRKIFLNKVKTIIKNS